MKRGMFIGVCMMALAGCATTVLGLGGTSWKEEVLLHDGSTIVVERWHKRGGRHELSSSPPVREQGIAFRLPGDGDSIAWRDDYSDDVGSATLVLLALHVFKSTPYLVAEPYGCIAYNKWGRPNPPYVVFKYDGGAWQRIELANLPEALKTINLLIGPSNEERKLSAFGTLSVAEIDKTNRGYKQPQYRSIVREPLPAGGIGCREMVYYKGGWVEPGEFGRRFMDTISK